LESGAGLTGGYALLVSSGMERAMQTLACFRGGLGQRVPEGVTVEPGLRTQAEDRWREIYTETGNPDLASFRAVDPEFVAAEVTSLGAALRRVFDRLEDGGRALAVGHSPTNEAAGFALTGGVRRALREGQSLLVVEEPRRGALSGGVWRTPP